MKRYPRRQCPPGLSSHDLPTKLIAALTFAPSWAQVVGTEADWNIKGEPCPQINDRRIDLHRGRYYTAMLRNIESNVPI